MKFYSEELKKFFDTAQDCHKAEEEARAEAVKREEAANKVSIQKADAAKKIELATERVKTAKAEYKKAEQEVKQLAKEYVHKVEQLITPAQEKINEATKARYKAIEDYNKEFGPYITTSVSNMDNDLFDLTDFDFSDIFKLFWE